MAPPIKAKPFARVRYFNGRISDRMACTIDMVERVVPIRMPPPMSMLIDVAFAEITAPTNATTGGIDARYFRSRTSDRRPIMGESTLCMSNGP